MPDGAIRMPFMIIAVLVLPHTYGAGRARDDNDYAALTHAPRDIAERYFGFLMGQLSGHIFSAAVSRCFAADRLTLLKGDSHFHTSARRFEGCFRLARYN